MFSAIIDTVTRLYFGITGFRRLKKPSEVVAESLSDGYEGTREKRTLDQLETLNEESKTNERKT